MKFNLFAAVFIGLSLYATLTRQNMYPINSYRMFSKNWLKQAVIPGVEAYRSDGSKVLIWNNTAIPFFQVNNAAIQTYYGPAKTNKEFFCQWVRAQNHADKIELFGVSRKYVRVAGQIHDDIVIKEKVYECANTTL